MFGQHHASQHVGLDSQGEKILHVFRIPGQRQSPAGREADFLIPVIHRANQQVARYSLARLVHACEGQGGEGRPASDHVARTAFLVPPVHQAEL